MNRQNRRKTALCGFCGIKSANTSDHVPPKAVFPKPRPSDLITVPSCFSCNNGSSTSDEEFAIYISTLVSEPGKEIWKLWKNHTLPTLRRNHRLYRNLTSHFVPKEVYSESGIYLGDAPEIRVNRSVYNKTIEKITRGLFFHHIQIPMNPNVQLTANMMTPLRTEDIQMISCFESNTVGAGQFTYWYMIDLGDPLNTHWIYCFHGHHWAQAYTVQNSI